MKYLKLIILFCFTAGFISCNEDDRQREILAVKTEKQNDSILNVISSNWKFNIPPVSSKAEAKLSGWNEWRQFKAELAEKPKGSLSAYRQKVKTIANKADQLNENIPDFFNKPQVRSRIGVLRTKVRSLYTYTNISVIPDKKVVGLINEITKETTSLQNQFNEIVVLSEVPKEMGEQEMLRALDTVRMANPDMMQQQEQEQKNKNMQLRRTLQLSPQRRQIKPSVE